MHRYIFAWGGKPYMLTREEWVSFMKFMEAHSPYGLRCLYYNYEVEMSDRAFEVAQHWLALTNDTQLGLIDPQEFDLCVDTSTSL